MDREKKNKLELGQVFSTFSFQFTGFLVEYDLTMRNPANRDYFYLPPWERQIHAEKSQAVKVAYNQLCVKMNSLSTPKTESQHFVSHRQVERDRATTGDLTRRTSASDATKR